MAELTISSDEIRSAIENYVSTFSPDTSREEVGTVAETGDGIARVEGLPSAVTSELLEFEGGVLGVAQNLDVHEIGAVILGDYEKIEEGQPVKRTGRVLSVPVGDAFLGRVINPLGEPIDGLGDIEASDRRALELQAPSVINRQPVKEALQTGLKAIDSMTPIGRGQRQLIIGDRKTGKTAVCVDTIINQKQNWASGVVGRLFDTSLLRYARIARLTPGSALVPHRDYLELDSDLIRIHLPLETDDACLNSHESVVYHMNVGEIWFLDATKTHSAFSAWDRDRTHLVLDFRAWSIDEIMNSDPSNGGIPPERTISRPPLTTAEAEAFVATGALMNPSTHREFLKIAITALFTRDIQPEEVFTLFESAAERSGEPAVIKTVAPMRAYFLHARPASR